MTIPQLRSRLLIIVIVLVLVGGLIAGLVVGLWRGWVTLPNQVSNADASHLDSPSQDEFIVLTASDYAFDQNLDRAKQRLAQLHDTKINIRLAALAKQYAAEDKSYASYVAALAVALGSSDSEIALIATTATPTATDMPTPTATATPLTPTATPTVVPTARNTPARTPTLRPRATATAAPAPIAATNWTPPYPAEWPGGVQFEPVTVAAGQKYWHLIKALYCDTNDPRNDCPDLPGGGIGTGVYVMLVDSGGGRASGVPLLLTKPDGKQDLLEEKSAGDICNCNYTFEANGFPVQVGGLPSDKISGMALFSVKAGLGNYHVRYFLTFQQITR